MSNKYGARDEAQDGARGEYRGPKRRRSIARRITAHQIGDQISLLMLFNIIVMTALSVFIIYNLCSFSVTINAGVETDSPHAAESGFAAGAGPDAPNILYDRFSFNKNIETPSGARVRRPFAPFLGLPDSSYIGFVFDKQSDVSLIDQWADVRMAIAMPHGDGKYNEIVFFHNSLFAILFRAITIMMLFQAIIVIRGAFHIARRTKKTLRPITDLTIAAQSMTEPASSRQSAAYAPSSAQRSNALRSDALHSTTLRSDALRSDALRSTTYVPTSARQSAAYAPAPAAQSAPHDDQRGHDQHAAPADAQGNAQPVAATADAAPAAAAAGPESKLKLSGAIDTLNMITEQHLDRRIAIDDERVELKGLASAINGMLDRLDAAYQAQLRFVSDASHELRTPISVIQGYANLLDRWGKNDEKTLQESIDAIKNESENMKDLVEQLLFLARGDNRSIEVTMGDVDITSLVEEVARETKLFDETHEYQVKAEEGLVAVGDCHLLKQALRVFVDNSAKYTPQGGRILLVAARSADMEGFLDVSVRDDGIGIPEEALPKIFDRFYRADESRARSSGGTGLGLSIAKWIVDNHNGLIDVVSRKDAGTKITMSIPEKPI